MLQSFGSCKVPVPLSTRFEDGSPRSRGWSEDGREPEETNRQIIDIDRFMSTTKTISTTTTGCGERASAVCASSPKRVTEHELRMDPRTAEWRRGSRSSPVPFPEPHVGSSPPRDMPRYVVSTLVTAAVSFDVYHRDKAPPGVWHIPQPPREVKLARSKPSKRLQEGNRVHGYATTLSINHFPIWLTKTPLRDLIDSTGFAGKYDYLYVPVNQSSGTSRGHAFVNFRFHSDASEFFQAWHGKRVYGSVVTVAVSVLQGFEASVAKWTTKKMQAITDPELLPFIQG